MIGKLTKVVSNLVTRYFQPQQLAQWQGLYEVIRRVTKINYCIEMHDKWKKLKTFHLNLFKEWMTPVQSVN